MSGVSDGNREAPGLAAGELTRWRLIEPFGGWPLGWHGRDGESKTGG